MPLGYEIWAREGESLRLRPVCWLQDIGGMTDAGHV